MVQTGYISDRDDCQARSNNGVKTYASSDAASMSGKELNNMKQQLFCECMKDHEWSVAGCKLTSVAKAAPAPAPAAPQQPTIVVVQAAPVAAAPPPPPEACPAPPPGKVRRRTPNNTCPAPVDASQAELDKVLNNTNTGR